MRESGRMRDCPPRPENLAELDHRVRLIALPEDHALHLADVLTLRGVDVLALDLGDRDRAGLVGVRRRADRLPGVRLLALAALLHVDLRLALGLVDDDLGLGALVADLRLAFGALHLHVRLRVGRPLHQNLRLAGLHLHLGLLRLRHLHLGRGLADRDLGLGHRDVHVRLGHADRDLGLRDVHRHGRSRLAHDDLGLALAHRDGRLRLTHDHARVRRIDLHDGCGLLHDDVGGVSGPSRRLRHGDERGRQRDACALNAHQAVPAGHDIAGALEAARLIEGHGRGRLGVAASLQEGHELLADVDLIGPGCGPRGGVWAQPKLGSRADDPRRARVKRRFTGRTPR
jgi:hypothetical protein